MLKRKTLLWKSCLSILSSSPQRIVFGVGGNMTVLGWDPQLDCLLKNVLFI